MSSFLKYFLVITAITMPLGYLFAGNSVGNGGDSVVSDFLLKIRKSTSEVAVSQGISDQQKIYLREINRSIKKIPVESKPFVFDGGQDAGVICRDRKIQVGQVWWQKVSSKMIPFEQFKINAFAAYLRCGGLEEDNYYQSKRLVKNSMLPPDKVRDDFVELAEGIWKKLKNYPNFQIAVETTEVRSEPIVFARNVEVDAANYPSENLIVVSQDRWQKINFSLDRRSLKTLVIIHEYLGIMGINDSDYSESHKLMAQLGYF